MESPLVGGEGAVLSPVGCPAGPSASTHERWAALSPDVTTETLPDMARCPLGGQSRPRLRTTEEEC